VGKSRLARRLTTILPALTLAEAIETTRIHSVAGRTGARTALVTTRPCRAPHHTISETGLIGGGPVPRPGEMSRAHHGILLLDELPEFRRQVLEGLRQPLEEALPATPLRGRPRPRHSRRARHQGQPPIACSHRRPKGDNSGGRRPMADITQLFSTAPALGDPRSGPGT
jgi:magnesium chelatase subunit ChlI-like protein